MDQEQSNDIVPDSAHPEIDIPDAMDITRLSWFWVIVLLLILVGIIIFAGTRINL